MIINAENLILGRLSTIAAKKALLGESIDLVNVEKAVIIGTKKNILDKYKTRRERGETLHGPYFPRTPDRLVRRTIRGMLPYKQEKGRLAFKRVKCHVGIPEDLKDKKLFSSIKQIHNFLESIVLKTVASLLNTNGGNLVIGVLEKDNKKEVLGIDREGLESHDKYERHITQLFINAFGKDITSKYITTSILKIEKKPVCNVICGQNPKDAMPIFYNEKMFIRTGPRVDELNHEELARYLLERKK